MGVLSYRAVNTLSYNFSNFHFEFFSFFALFSFSLELHWLQRFASLRRRRDCRRRAVRQRGCGPEVNVLTAAGHARFAAKQIALRRLRSQFRLAGFSAPPAIRFRPVDEVRIWTAWLPG